MHFLSGIYLFLSLGLCIWARRMDVSPSRKFPHYINSGILPSGFSFHNFNKPQGTGYSEYDNDEGTSNDDRTGRSRSGFSVDNFNRPGGSASGSSAGFSVHNFNRPGGTGYNKYSEYDNDEGTSNDDRTGRSRSGFSIDNFNRPGGSASGSSAGFSVHNFNRPGGTGYSKYDEFDNDAGTSNDDKQNGPGDDGQAGLAAMQDAYDLGRHMMGTGFALYSKGPISVYKLIKGYLKGTSGSSRMMMLRIVEILDKDMDQMVSVDEFVETIGIAAANPGKAAEMIFQMYDLDRNGAITKYEWATVLMMQAETDMTMLDIWRQVSQNFHDRDFNENGVVDVNEFILNELYEVAAAIGNEIEDTDFTAA